MVEFETVYHGVWQKQARDAKAGLKGSLLLRAGQEKDYVLNFSPQIYQICREGRFIKKIHLEVPPEAEELFIQEDRLREYHKDLETLIESFRETRGMVTPVMAPFLRFFVTRMENALRPGNALLTWDSLNVPHFIEESRKEIDSIKGWCRIDNTNSKLTPILAGLDVTYDGGWSLKRPFSLNLSYSERFMNFDPK